VKPIAIIAQVEGSGAAMKSIPCGEATFRSGVSTTPVTGFTVATSLKLPSAMIGVPMVSPVTQSL
jgi:hypothetical protein